MIYLKSPIRYVGAKNWLVSTLCQEITDTNPKLYVEPFVGGAAIALNVPYHFPKYLADTNTVVMDMWRCIRSTPNPLLVELSKLEKQYPNTNEGYLKARQELNSMILSTRPIWIRRAALFLYINARCFNGLWRTNSKGFFNVPYGKLEKPVSIDRDEAAALSRRLQYASFHTQDYATTLEAVPLEGTAIYADPPYDGTFAGYGAGGFDEADQRALAVHLQSCAERGARVWATNADTKLIREIYSWAEITSIEEQHNVGATGERRGKRSCVLIRG